MTTTRRLAAMLLLATLSVTRVAGAQPGVSSSPSGDITSTEATTRVPLPPDQRYPPRAVGSGAKYGLVSGAVAGVGFGLLIVALFELLDDDDLTLGEQALVTGYFGLNGAAGGGILGAWLGSLVSKDPTDGLPRGTRPIRSLALTGGYADFTTRDDTEGGFQGRATLYSHFEPWLAVGAEYGILTGSPHSWRLAAGVRVDPFPVTQTVRPYLAGSVGGNFWQVGESLLSGDAGVGVELPFKAGRSAVGLEGRYHFNLQNAVEPGTYRYASVGLTWRIDS